MYPMVVPGGDWTSISCKQQKQHQPMQRSGRSRWITSTPLLSVIDMANGLDGPQHWRTIQLESIRIEHNGSCYQPVKNLMSNTFKLLLKVLYSAIVWHGGILANKLISKDWCGNIWQIKIEKLKVKYWQMVVDLPLYSPTI